MSSPLQHPLTHIALCVAAAVAVIAFLLGTTGAQPVPPSAARHQAAREMGEAPAAVAYGQLANSTLRANASWESTLSRLRPHLVTDTEPPSDTARAAALLARAERRAYAGAPPTIPHAIDQRDVASCLACHGEGLRVGDRFAAKVSHPHYTSCTQCHAPATPAALPARQPPASDFVAVQEPTAGPRAYAGAPPQMPHGTWLRQDCLSCHGPAGAPGLRTSHPERQNCQQCHADPASSQTRRLLEAGFPAYIPESPAQE